MDCSELLMRGNKGGNLKRHPICQQVDSVKKRRDDEDIDKIVRYFDGSLNNDDNILKVEK